MFKYLLLLITIIFSTYWQAQAHDSSEWGDWGNSKIFTTESISADTSDQSIYLDHIDGIMWHNQPDSMIAGSTYVFNIRLINNAIAQSAIYNGFRIYSPDGATWTTTIGDTTGTLSRAQFDTFFAINLYSITGSGADTIGFVGLALNGGGLPIGFDNIAYKITIGPIPTGSSNHGKTICLDSTFFPPSGTWRWVATGLDIFPSWDGPHCYTIVDMATDIFDKDNNLPSTIILNQNYPNPFNPSTSISFSLSEASDVKFEVFNILGQNVETLINGSLEAGNHTVYWDGKKAASGVYMYKLTAGDFIETKKMMLLK